jgi:hypothetical protein
MPPFRRVPAAALVVLLAGAAGWLAALAAPSADAGTARATGRLAQAAPGDGDDQGENQGGGGHQTPRDTATTTSTATQTTTSTGTTTTPGPTTGPGPDAGAGADALPAAPPQLGHTVALATASGTVLVRAPGRPLARLATAAAPPLPTGTHVDTRAGEVLLTAALDATGATQTARFSGGIFEVRQTAAGLTQLVLLGGAWGGCRATRTPKATAAATTTKKKRKPIRSLWGTDDHGRFQTRGGGSVATVRGTRWLTEDFCDGTRTTVVRGAVDVRSRRTGRTVRVRAGHALFVAR